MTGTRSARSHDACPVVLNRTCLPTITPIRPPPQPPQPHQPGHHSPPRTVPPTEFPPPEQSKRSACRLDREEEGRYLDLQTSGSAWSPEGRRVQCRDKGPALQGRRTPRGAGEGDLGFDVAYLLPTCVADGRRRWCRGSWFGGLAREAFALGYMACLPACRVLREVVLGDGWLRGSRVSLKRVWVGFLFTERMRAEMSRGPGVMLMSMYLGLKLPLDMNRTRSQVCPCSKLPCETHVCPLLIQLRLGPHVGIRSVWNNKITSPSVRLRLRRRRARGRRKSWPRLAIRETSSLAGQPTSHQDRDQQSCGLQLVLEGRQHTLRTSCHTR